MMVTCPLAFSDEVLQPQPPLQTPFETFQVRQAERARYVAAKPTINRTLAVCQSMGFSMSLLVAVS